MYPYDAVNIWPSENSPVTVKKFRLGGSATTRKVITLFKDIDDKRTCKITSLCFAKWWLTAKNKRTTHHFYRKGISYYLVQPNRTSWSTWLPITSSKSFTWPIYCKTWTIKFFTLFQVQWFFSNIQGKAELRMAMTYEHYRHNC